MAARPKYYTVWKGRRRGIFTSWAECEAQVKGFQGAQYKAFESRTAAEAALRKPFADFKAKPAPAQKWLLARAKPLVPSLAVDAACDGSPGRLEYRGVQTGDGAQVFRAGPFADGTNNVGEFLAIVRAMDYLSRQRLDWPIYSDSTSAIAWVRQGRCKTKLARLPSNTMLFQLISRAEGSLKALKGFRVLKWDTEAWGENPADFGRK